MELKKTIDVGQVFVANSHGKMAVWEVIKRIKTEFDNRIWCNCIHGMEKSQVYTGRQFGFLIRTGAVRLITM